MLVNTASTIYSSSVWIVKPCRQVTYNLVNHGAASGEIWSSFSHPYLNRSMDDNCGEWVESMGMASGHG